MEDDLPDPAGPTEPGSPVPPPAADGDDALSTGGKSQLGGLGGDDMDEEGGGGAAPAGDARDEKAKLKPLCDFEVQAGCMYYLVATAWWNQWKDWVAFSEDDAETVGSEVPPPPRKIDNSILLQVGQTAKLSTRIVEEQDFVYVTAAAWDLLLGWYPGSGPPLARRGINPNSHSRYGAGARAVVELHGVSIAVFLSTQLEEKPLPKVSMVVSKASTVRELKELIVKHYAPALDGKEIRIWDYFRSSPFALLDTPSNALNQYNMMEDNDILVELPDAKGDFHIKKASTTTTTSSSSYSSYSSYGNTSFDDCVTSTAAPPAKGVVGLVNLGNTCFMNSTLQCLSNIPRLRKRFTAGTAPINDTSTSSSASASSSSSPSPSSPSSSSSSSSSSSTTDEEVKDGSGGGGGDGSSSSSSSSEPPPPQTRRGSFWGELNRGNPLGHEGKLAETFGGLMQLMWPADEDGSVSTVAPRGFKYQMGRFRQEFQGFQQHDSSELMNFLLDGMHEDLNRVLQKPYVEAVDYDPKKSDAAMAQEFLDAYKLRNDSCIHDMFRGQFKSTLFCPECKKSSVTFDPYTMLSLPLRSSADEQKQFFKVKVWRRGTKGLGSAATTEGGGDEEETAWEMVPGQPMESASASSGGGGNGSDDDEEGEEKEAAATVDDEADARKRAAVAACAEVEAGRRFFTVENVGIPKTGATAKMLRAAVAERVGIPPARLALVQFWNHAVSKYFSDVDSLAYVNSHAEWVAVDVEDALCFNGGSASYYRYSRDSPPADHPLAAVTIKFRREETSAYSYYRPRTIQAFYAEPLLFCHPKATTPKDLYGAVAAELGAGVTPDMFKLFVSHDDNGHNVDKTEVDRTDTSPIKQGMKAFILLVFEWEEALEEDAKRLRITHTGLFDEEADGGDEDGDGSGEEGGGKGAAAGGAAGKGKNGGLTLMDCFELFSTPEKLEESDMWYCGTCKEHVRATKTMHLWSVPDVLVLHLKRFAFTSFRREKVDMEVDFPLDGLDLSKYVQGELSGDGDAAIYDCVAVSNHMGNLGGGHYVAAARNSEDSKWYKYNDSHTSEMRASDVRSGDGLSTAYLLFYVRRGAREG